jgi:DNA-binding beta-propeller fold protein YncE
MTDSKECKIIDTIDVKNPRSIIRTPCGNFIIITEGASIAIYNLETKQKFRIAGSVEQRGHQNGTRDESRLDSATSLTLSKDCKTLFVSDRWNNVILAICVSTGVTTTFAGQFHRCEHVDGPKEKACFFRPESLQMSPDGKTLFIIDFQKLRTICIATGQVETIHTFEHDVWDFVFSQDGKHIIICHWTQVSKYNLETGKSVIILKDGNSFIRCKMSNNGLLFISNLLVQNINIVNFETNEIIDTITTSFDPCDISFSTKSKHMYVTDTSNDKIQVFDISEYCTNFKTFTQLQLVKHSFLSRQVIEMLLSCK